ASYKKLQRKKNGHGFFINNTSFSGFGVVFAYETEMHWDDIVSALKEEIQSNETKLLPNAVFILNKGYFLFGNNNEYLRRISLHFSRPLFPLTSAPRSKRTVSCCLNKYK
ncbi:hypothetical protein AB0U51_15205, partial [Escherichia coli]